MTLHVPLQYSMSTLSPRPHILKYLEFILLFVRICCYDNKKKEEDYFEIVQVLRDECSVWTFF